MNKLKQVKNIIITKPQKLDCGKEISNFPIFILPPSKTELKRRLIKRGRDNKQEISLRLSYAIDEMKHYREYKYVLINKNGIFQCSLRDEFLKQNIFDLQLS